MRSTLTARARDIAAAPSRGASTALYVERVEESGLVEVRGGFKVALRRGP